AAVRPGAWRRLLLPARHLRAAVPGAAGGGRPAGGRHRGEGAFAERSRPHHPAVMPSHRTRGDRMQAGPPSGYHRPAVRTYYDRLVQYLDHKIGWHRLPTPLGLGMLIGLRDALRKANLHDTSGLPAVDLPPLQPGTPDVRVARTVDGSYNDLANPRMGMAGSRFGRNAPLQDTFPDPSPPPEPNPREVSRALLTRDALIPATSVNALVAAWLQFMIRDWFSHGKGPQDDPWQIPLADDDPWPERPMRVMRTRPDPTAPPGGSGQAPTYATPSPQGGAAAQIYGNTIEHRGGRRPGREGVLRDGKRRVARDGLPPMPDDPESDPRQVPGFWLGLLLMQTL